MLYLASPTWAKSPFEENLDPSRVVWTHLVFQANKYLGKVRVDVQFGFISSTEAQRTLIASPTGIPVPMSSPMVCYISVHRSVDPAFGSKITEEDRVWFSPKQASALGRIRLRRGNDDFKKIYRFTHQGVFRHRIEPKDKKEAKLEPEKWTDIEDTFYAYDPARLGCPGVFERSILMYITSTASFSNRNEPLSLCVFGKRQLHRIQLRAEGEHRLKVNYVGKTLQNEVRKEKTVETLKIGLTAEPMESDLKDRENFSFLGIHKNIAIYIDPASRMPVQVSGVVPVIGKTNLTLREVRLKN